MPQDRDDADGHDGAKEGESGQGHPQPPQRRQGTTLALGKVGEGLSHVERHPRGVGAGLEGEEVEVVDHRGSLTSKRSVLSSRLIA